MNAEHDKIAAALALSRVQNVGPVTYRAPAHAFGGPAEALVYELFRLTENAIY